MVNGTLTVFLFCSIHHSIAISCAFCCVGSEVVPDLDSILEVEAYTRPKASKDGDGQIILQ